MSEFIAEASVLITPKTTGFSAELTRQVKKAIAESQAAIGKGVVVPVTTVGASAAAAQANKELQRGISTVPIGIVGSGTGTADLKRQLAGVDEEVKKTTKSTTVLSKTNKEISESAKRSAADVAKQRREMSQLERGAAATALSMGGVRGATLAASGAFLAGAAAIAIFAKALFSATKFTQQLNVFQATTSATADQMQRVASAAKQLGADITLPGVSASDAAEAMTELAKAGLSVQDSIDGARGVLQLATAAAITNAEATQIAASALNAFGLAGNQASKVADTLANAANAAQGSIADIGLALQQAAAVGHLVGLSFQDTTVFLTALARAGLRSSDAGTSLRTTIVRLINPTKDAKAIFDKFGISVRDAQGHLRPDFFVNLGAALKSMTKEQRDATLAQIGGQDAVRALSILTGQSIRQLTGLRDELNKQGTASKVASARMQGLAGAGASLSNTLQNVGIAIGQAATPAMTGLVNAITQVVQVSSAAVSSMRDFGKSIGLGVPEVLAAVSALVALKGALVLKGAVQASFGASAAAPTFLTGLAARAFLATKGLAGLRLAFSGLISPTAAWAIGLAAVGVGIAFLVTRESDLEKAHKALSKATDDLASSTSDLFSLRDTARSTANQLQFQEQATGAAQLAVAQARSALESSRAAAGSFARTQLENNLTIALQNQRQAEDDLSAARRRNADAAEAVRAASQRVRQAQLDEVNTLRDLIRLQREANGLAVPVPRGLQQIAGFAQLATGVTAAEGALKDFNRTLDDEIAKQQKSNTEGSRLMLARLRDIKALVQATKQVPTELQLKVFLTAPNVETGLRRLRAVFQIEGNKVAVDFLDRLEFGLQNGIGPRVASSIQTGAAEAQEAARAGGAALGTTMGNAVVESFDQAMQRLNVSVLRAQVAGSQAGEIAAQRAIITKARAEAARARRAGDLKAEQQALQDEKQAQDAIAAIQAQQQSDAEKAARERQQAADKVQQARDKADQAFQNALGLKEQRLQNRLAIAELSKSLVDDIQAHVRLRNFYAQVRANLRNEIHDADLRRQLYLELSSKIISETAAIKQLQAQRRQNRIERAKARAEAAKEARDRRQESLQLDIELAQTTGNVKGEIAAREKYIAFLVRLAHRVKLGSNAWKRIRNEIAAERKAIADLRKEQKKAINDVAALQFEFLQAQQGFAGTLLSNLLPLGALGGVVGGTTAGGGGGGGVATALGTESEIAQAARRGQGATGGLAAQAQIARDKGATQGQMSSLITLTQQMVRILHRLAGDRLHPEAKNQRLRGTAQMEV